MTRFKSVSSVAAPPLLFATGAIASTPSASGLQDLGAPVVLVRRGADDPAGDDLRGRDRGSDDSAGHS